jgi:formylglycine-generating enzyme required for sulfatase activity
VDSYADGASPFGVYNMAGNVTEWVDDVYDTGYYANSPASNPVNGGSGAHVHRGGSFANANGENYTTSRRYRSADTDVDVGFRCVQDAPEENAATPPEARDQLVADFCQAYSAYKPGATCP